jgi:hypothetical protein
MEPYFQYFVVGGGAILAQLDTLPEAAEAIRLRGDAGTFVLECKANLERTAGAMAV